MAREKKEDKEILKKQEVNQQQWVDTYFNTNLNGRMTSKFLKPHLTLNAAEVDAARMLGNARIKELIEIKQEQIRIKQEITLDFIVENLKSVIYDCKSEQIERDADGRITNKPDRQNLIKAVDLLAKLGGHYTNKIDITSGGEKIKIDFTD